MGISPSPLGWLALGSGPHGLSRHDRGYSDAARIVGQPAGSLGFRCLAREGLLPFCRVVSGLGRDARSRGRSLNWSEFPPSSACRPCAFFDRSAETAGNDWAGCVTGQKGLFHPPGSKVVAATSILTPRLSHPQAPRGRSFSVRSVCRRIKPYARSVDLVIPL